MAHPVASVAVALGTACLATATAVRAVGEEAVTPLEILPRDELFAPLVADPNWPRFSISHEWRFGTDEFDRAGQVSFGESVAFVRGVLSETSEWELGLQAQLDALFDVTTRSFDLANEDYFVGITASHRVRRVTTQLRVAHVSSHVGDEYLLSTGGGRESVSYETVDVLAAWETSDSLRLYGGGGVYVSGDPGFDPVYIQAGAEWRSISGLAGDRIRPIAGVDLQIRQESDWIPDVAALVGLRLSKSRQDETRYVDLFVRAYHGRSPEGQFFRQDVSLLGIGVRLGL